MARTSPELLAEVRAATADYAVPSLTSSPKEAESNVGGRSMGSDHGPVRRYEPPRLVPLVFVWVLRIEGSGFPLLWIASSF